MCLSCTVFETQRVICRFYPTPLAFDAPVGVTPFKFRKDYWHQKAGVPGLSCDVICVIQSVAISIQYRFVTDRRTDGQKDRQTHDDGYIMPR